MEPMYSPPMLRPWSRRGSGSEAMSPMAAYLGSNPSTVVEQAMSGTDSSRARLRPWRSPTWPN
jgi:hypothetical protein